MPEKPASEKKMLEQVWYGLFGTPGSAGVVDRVASIEKTLSSNGKPTRWKIAGGILGMLVMLQTLGLLDALKGVVSQWLNGGAG